nr:hypothetical protein GCM10020063_063730 [Dactylosporangium thailandense]
MLLRRIGALACLLVALAAVAVADRAGSPAGNRPRRYGDVASGAPAGPQWWQLPHPPREVWVDVQVRADGDGAAITTTYDFALRPDDPLVALVRTGEVDGGALAARHRAGRGGGRGAHRHHAVAPPTAPRPSPSVSGGR